MHNTQKSHRLMFELIKNNTRWGNSIQTYRLYPQEATQRQ